MMASLKAIVVISILLHALVAKSFQPPRISMTKNNASVAALHAAAASTAQTDDNTSKSYLYSPKERDEHYQGNIAQYLVDLHNEQATFNFCGGMMFQLVLSEKLKSHLEGISADNKENQQPNIFDASKRRMESIPNYQLDAKADNINVFHGREIRQVPDAKGGMGFVLQLSHSSEELDPEGWTSAEIEGYDGWAHDSSRVWRKGDRLVSEGFEDFQKRFGPNAFALHHRFYLHLDQGNSMWLSAEDGCEGTPQVSGDNGVVNRIASLMGFGA